MNLKVIILIIIGLSFSSCNNDDLETIELSDITGHSKRYKEDKSVIIEDEIEEDSTLVIKDWFVNKGITIKSVEFRLDRMFLDRFGAKSDTKYTLITPVDTILYSKWVYEDSLKVMNAFTNWTNCFGENCKTILFGEEKNFQKNSFQVFISDTVLIFIEGRKNLNFKLWNQFHNVDKYNKVWNYMIEQSIGSRSRWYRFKEGKRTKLIFNSRPYLGDEYLCNEMEEKNQN